jgi:hypothetical protein
MIESSPNVRFVDDSLYARLPSVVVKVLSPSSSAHDSSLAFVDSHMRCVASHARDASRNFRPPMKIEDARTREFTSLGAYRSARRPLEAACSAEYILGGEISVA